MGVKLDRLTVALLILRPDAPKLGDQEAAALQDAHLSHLAGLHDAGHLLAAGPLLDPDLRGLNILSVPMDEANRLFEQDPTVQIGRLKVKTIEWMVPSGAIRFARTRLPRSSSEVEE